MPVIKKYLFWLHVFITVTTHGTGTVIVLHGTGSSGKTSISKILQQKLPGAVCVSIDDFLWPALFESAMQRKLIKKSMNKEEKLHIVIDHIEKLSGDLTLLIILQKLYTHTKNLAQTHDYVILDTVFGVNQKKDYNYFCSEMNHIKVFSVLVYCPPISIAEHVIKRNTANKKEEQRDIISHIRNFTKIYVPSKQPESSIDMLSQQEITKALNIAQTYLLKIGYWKFLVRRKIKDIQEKYLKSFFSNHAKSEQKIVHIQSLFPYDCIVNTQKLSPTECTQIIYQQFLVSLDKK